jgi:hypothetical protein
MTNGEIVFWLFVGVPILTFIWFVMILLMVKVFKTLL